MLLKVTFHKYTKTQLVFIRTFIESVILVSDSVRCVIVRQPINHNQ